MGFSFSFGCLTGEERWLPPSAGDAAADTRDPRMIELAEIQEMAARNQRQLDRLSQWVDARPQSPRSPLTCWRCQRPGHLARECDAPRVTRRGPPSPAVQPGRDRRGSPRQPTRAPAASGLDSHSPGGGRPPAGDSNILTQSPSGVLWLCMCVCVCVVLMVLVNLLSAY